MTPSERIQLISDIADNFAEKDWSIIDLTLRMFELPWQEEWSGNRHAYIMAMIENADDHILLSLANHLRIYPPLPPRKTVVPFSKVKDAIQQVELQKALMISVSTGGQRIQQVNEEYKERRIEIASTLDQIGVVDPNPFPDLWNWYSRWSDGSLPTYQSRRIFLSELFQVQNTPYIEIFSPKNCDIEGVWGY